VAEMAPRMNEVVKAARDMGMLIIHCPSDTMEFYRDHPGRKLAQQAPPVETKIPLERWCYLDKEHEGQLPIDDSDNGCDCDPSPKSYRAWKRQIETIEIKDGDALADEIDSFLDCVRMRTLPLVGGSEGLQALEIASMISAQL